MSRTKDKINILLKLTPRRVMNLIRLRLSYFRSKRGKVSLKNAMPISLSIEPTTACNLGCPECPSGLKIFARPTGNIHEELNKKIIDELAPYVFYLNFYFQGEPFIHPKFLNLVKYAKAKKIYTATSTNAHFLSSEKARETVESGLDRLIISIDGTSQDTYEKYRVNGKLEKVLEGTRNILEWKKKLRSSTPHVIFQFLVVRPNEHQVDDLMKIASELGVDEVRLKTAQVYNFKNGNPLIPANEKYSRYKLHADGTYSVNNKMENHCWRMWSSSVITWDGKVVPCCFDKDAEHRLGDISQQSFSEVWNSSEYMQFRKAVLTSRKEIDICSNCSEGSKVWS